MEPMAVDASDEELMRRVQREDRQAFTELVRRHRERVMRVGYGILRNAGGAEDVVQEAFLRVWTRAPDWDAERGRFVAWLVTIATRLAIDQRRGPACDPIDNADELPSADPDAEALASGGEIGRRIDLALGRLPLRQRTALVLCQIDGLSNAEAAASMGIGLGALEQLLVRARRAIREQLADLMEAQA